MELDYRQAAELLFSAENPRLTYLGIFFSVEENMKQILPLFSKKKKTVSKTLIEWTIIKLAKMIPLEFEWKGQRINIGDEYTLFRSQGTKEHSDPFARRPRTGAILNGDNIKFEFLYDQHDATKSIETTEAQLTFFKWIIVRGILEYIQRHVVRLNQLYTVFSALKKQTGTIRMQLGSGGNEHATLDQNITIYTTPPVPSRTGSKQQVIKDKDPDLAVSEKISKNNSITIKKKSSALKDLVSQSTKLNVTFVGLSIE